MKSTLCLTNDVNEVAKLAEWVERLADECSLPPDKAFQLNLALEEAVVNIINYAYPGQKGMPIRLEAEDFADRIEFLLADQGVPFDPTKALRPDVTLSAEERPIGGLGIMLVRQFMTSMSYEYANGSNRLLLTMEK